MSVAKILVAQDGNGYSLSACAGALRGYETLLACTLKDAVTQIGEDKFDLVVVDVHFDESRAIELATYIRGAKKDLVPILILRLQASDNEVALRKTLDSLVKLGTVSQYLEVKDDPDAVEKIRSAVEAYLPVFLK